MREDGGLDQGRDDEDENKWAKFEIYFGDIIHSTDHLFKVYNSMDFNVFTELCNYHHNQFQNIVITPKETLSFSHH